MAKIPRSKSANMTLSPTELHRPRGHLSGACYGERENVLAAKAWSRSSASCRSRRDSGPSRTRLSTAPTVSVRVHAQVTTWPSSESRARADSLSGSAATHGGERGGVPAPHGRSIRSSASASERLAGSASGGLSRTSPGLPLPGRSIPRRSEAPGAPRRPWPQEAPASRPAYPDRGPGPCRRDAPRADGGRGSPSGRKRMRSSS